ncbi:MAG TPA: efflux RND transporter periplasmic adaptor subunit [Thermoanaerobaculia bacterium]|jgi:RND family efflux transporter MFP subunit|nr:efflux RND transporter periplasmic adaptor subunit [Thermoanaerobaculia bacterium]
MKRTVAVAAMALVAAAGCRKKAPPAPPPTPVAVKTLRPVPVPRTTEYVATLQSRQSITLQPQVEGHVTRIFVRSGDRVAAGAPLLQIDPEKQQATVHASEATHASKVAALRLASEQHARIAKLFSEGLASQQDLDQAQSALESAQADARTAEAQVRQESVDLGYYRVEAPAAGIVGDIPVRVGDRVTNSTTLTTLDRVGSGLEAYVSVPVERSADLKVGLPVEIVDDAGAVLARTRINFVAPRVSDETQAVLAKAPIDDPKGALRPAELVRARIVWSSTPALTIPVVAVVRISGQDFAFVVDGPPGATVARQRPIQLGEIVGNDYIVREGLKAGDRVVVGGVQKIGDGAPVNPES